MRKGAVYLTTSFKFCENNSYLGSRLHCFFEMNGFPLTKDPFQAEFIIITTCGFDGERESCAVSLVRSFLRDHARRARIIVCGCLPRMNQEIARDKRIISVGLNEMSRLNDIFSAEVKIEDVDAHTMHQDFYTNSRHSSDWAYIQISQGCLNRCSYCVIKKAKGALSSKSPDQVIREFESGIKAGFRKFFFLADDCGSYGVDLGTDFSALLNLVYGKFGNKISGLAVSYFEPGRLVKLYPSIRKDVFKKIEFMNVPLQTASPGILRLMNRHYDIEEVLRILSDIRNINKKLLVITHFIYGFPGESREDLTASFSLRDHFDRLEYFYYTDRPGTPSSQLPNKIPRSEVMHRASLVLQESLKNPERVSNELALFNRGVSLGIERKSLFSSISRNVPEGPVDILLINPAFPHAGKDMVCPSSILSIAAPLVHHGFRVKVLDGRLEPCLFDKIKELAQRNTLLCVVMSCYTGDQIKDLVRTASFIKSKFNMPIVLDPECAMSFSDSVLEYISMGFILSAEERAVLEDLIRMTKNRKLLNKVLGKAFVRKVLLQGAVKKPEYRRASCGLPYYLVSEYVSAYTDFYLRVDRKSSPESVLRQIRELSLYFSSCQEVFIDGIFLFSPEKMRRFSSALLSARKKGDVLDFFWGAEIQVRTVLKMPRVLFKKLVASGLKTVFIEAGSGSDKVLSRMKNKFRVKDIIKANRFLRDFDINVQYRFVAGLSFEEAADVEATSHLMRSLKKENPKCRLRTESWNRFSARCGFGRQGCESAGRNA